MRTFYPIVEGPLQNLRHGWVNIYPKPLEPEAAALPGAYAGVLCTTRKLAEEYADETTARIGVRPTIRVRVIPKG